MKNSQFYFCGRKSKTGSKQGKTGSKQGETGSKQGKTGSKRVQFFDINYI
ncbi:hypothetical protein GQG71_001776 [Salmonella enterica]|nr:hypothetical protein [Salmonella enterica subsp. enterica serovar Kokomlemle]EEF6840681.1 hypothetical protein [Salmonella enterica]EJB7648972.1 hypothetical protein [Salmonella enterica]